MPDRPNSNLFDELKRRNVFRVGVAYTVFAWVIAQVADLVLDAMNSPDWILQAVLIAMAIGFIPALIFAWVFELTTEGLKKEREVDRGQSITSHTGRKLDFVIIGIMAVAIVLLVSERVGVFDDLKQPDGVSAVTLRSIAVLPFANRSADDSDKYFVDGIHDDVLTQLSKIHELKVVSRTSVEQYRGTNRPIPDIGQELGADAIIEGAVQRSGDRVRITVQLIESESDEHIWAESYDREISAASIFAIQSEIALAIADQLRATITDAEQDEINTVPTESYAAYDLYLQGADLVRIGDPDSYDEAADLFRQALDVDPEYARAYAGLCAAFLQKYQSSSDTSLVPRAESYCNRALEIDETLFEVRMSLGNLYLATGESEEAEKQFLQAIATNPESDVAWRSLGRSYLDREIEPEAEEALQYAISLAPENPNNHSALAFFHYVFGRFEEATESYAKAIEIDPEDPGYYASLGATKFLMGDFAGTDAAWRRSLALDENQPSLIYNLGTALFFEKRFEDALEMYLRSSEQRPDDQLTWGAIGDTYRFIGNKEAESREAYETAIRLAERIYLVNPNDLEIVSALARFYATTGQLDKAQKFLDIALTIGGEEMYMWYDRSLTYLALDRIDEAIEAAQQLVARGYSTEILASDVMFTEIADDPRFRAIVEAGE